MDTNFSPKISSFVLRFTQENPEDNDAQVVFRGSIRHVQTNQELSFVNWEKALAFMCQFVPDEVFEIAEKEPADSGMAEES